MDNQLAILIDSLDLKIEVLKDIQVYNLKQEQIFQSDQVDIDGFDDAIDEKGKLIERLNKLDTGFENLYEKLAVQLREDKGLYVSEIKIIQNKISLIMEMNTTITAQEKRNKKLVEQYFAKQKANLSSRRKNSRAAYDYYKKMNANNYSEPQFYDSKK